ncbi:MAG: hypothetical protein AAGA55_03520 [Planctomycetota bacterium]
MLHAGSFARICFCLIAAVSAAASLSACHAPRPEPDLGLLYNQAAMNIGDSRTPVVVIPGILGTKIEDDTTGQKIWGSFTFGAADADLPQGARTFALPMERGVPLSDLTDDGIPVDVLDVVVADVGIFRGLEFAAYVDILATLAAGNYRDESLGRSGAIDYGGLHFTCFQYSYDWRRDVSESARALHDHIVDAQWQVRQGRGLDADDPVRVDVVAHSMGGLVLRYYLRYGTQPLPEDGSLPELTWAGAEHIGRAYLIGTPSAGSVHSFRRLVEGLNLNPLFPNYRPAVVGTMPALYQLLPRPRHARVIDADGNPVDILDADVWASYGWGLADPETDGQLEWLLPEVDSAEERRAIAMDHLRKCLARADQFFRAIDAPVSPPTGTGIYLFAGDADETESVLRVDERGRIALESSEPGDGTVTRSSALMDERLGSEWSTGLESPIDFERVQFLNADHLGLTRSPAFTDNLLYYMLEDPRR